MTKFMGYCESLLSGPFFSIYIDLFLRWIVKSRRIWIVREGDKGDVYPTFFSNIKWINRRIFITKIS